MIVMMFNNHNSLIGISKGAVSISSAAAEFTATKIESDCKVTSKLMIIMMMMMKMIINMMKMIMMMIGMKMIMMKMKMIINMIMIETMSLILLITIMMMLMTVMLIIYLIYLIITIYHNHYLSIYLSTGMSDAHVTIIGAGKMARLLLIHLQTQGKDASCCRCLVVIRP
jgi:hypothetical protein